MRKFFIGFISLGAMLAIYLLYSRVSKIPPTDTGTTAEFVNAIAESNVGEFGGEMGKIGDVGVDVVKKTRYLHRNENKEVDREVGFEELLHRVGDVWEVEKPYMNVYKRNFKCYVTADTGMVQVESAVGRPSPKDATFTGNVVVHILPAGSGGIKESFIYLDDIAFLGEKSQFSTAGPVKFVSEDARMHGTGLELVYNEQMERLEFFRIIELESLRFRSSQSAFLSSAKTETDKPAAMVRQAKAQRPDKPVAAGGSKKKEALRTAARPQAEQDRDEYYRCVLYKNVFIDTPEQLVFAREQVTINDILWSKESSGQSNEAATSGADDTKKVAGAAEKRRRNKAGKTSTDNVKANNVIVSKQSEPNEAAQEFVDIVITCDGSIVVTPMDLPRAPENPAKAGTGESGSDSQWLEKLNDAAGRTTFITQRIDHNATTGDAIASGLSELTFYGEGVLQKNRKTETNTSDTVDAETRETAVPMKITARKEVKFLSDANQVIFEGDCTWTIPQEGSTGQQNYTLSAPQFTINLPEDRSKWSSSLPDIFASGPAELKFYVDDFGGVETGKAPLPAKLTGKRQGRFIAALNQVVFEGDCRCTMLREDPNVVEEYILSSQEICVDLPKDTNDRSSESTVGIEHLTATGGVVRLATVKTSKQKSLGGVELECRRFDYDADQELYTATGPGRIKLDNSAVAEPNEQKGGFSLKGPCWAIVENFDTLKYFLKTNKIIAEAGSEGGLVVNYFPIREGKFAKDIVVNAGHVEADLKQTAEGQTELSTLTASGGINYKEGDDNEFIGSELFYDHNKLVMKVKGNELQPCYLNGALVDGIEYDLKTGRSKAKIVGPGSLQINR